MSDVEHLIEPEEALQNIPLPSTTAAFVESELIFWNNRQLHALDVMRRSAAYAMGLRYDRWRKEDVIELAETGVYSSLPNDVVIVLYVCSLSKTARRVKVGEGAEATYEMPMTVPRIFSDPEGALALAYEWAAEEGIDFDEASLPKAAAVFSKIMRPIDRSKFKVVPRKGAEGATSSAETSPNA